MTVYGQWQEKNMTKKAIIIIFSCSRSRRRKCTGSGERGAKSTISWKRLVPNGCKGRRTLLTNCWVAVICYMMLDCLSVWVVPTLEQTAQTGTNPFEKPLQTHIVWYFSAPLKLRLVQPTHQNKQKLCTQYGSAATLCLQRACREIFLRLSCVSNSALIRNFSTKQQQKE